MDNPSLQLISEASQWQKPFAIVFWLVLVLICLGVSFYAYFKGDKVPPGIIKDKFRWGWPLIGKVRNKYPVILAFAVGGLVPLIVAAVITSMIETRQLGKLVYDILGNEVIQALTLLVSSSFYSILTAWLLTETEDAESLSGVPRGRDAAAFWAGILMGIQFAYLLATLYFFQESKGS